MEYRLEPIDGGFREFKGVYTQTTMDKYNTLQLEVYQLEAFAEYSDTQSQEWLEAMIKKTKGKYSKWEKVSNYLGIQRRM